MASDPEAAHRERPLQCQPMGLVSADQRPVRLWRNHPRSVERAACAWRALARYAQALFLRAFSSAGLRNCIAPAQRAYTRGSPREWSEQIRARRLTSAVAGAEDGSILLAASFAASSAVCPSA